MSSAKQTIVEAMETEKAISPKSTTDTKLLKQMFKHSPIYTGELSDAERTKTYQDRVLDAKINDGGHTFGTFDTSFAGKTNKHAPDYAKVKRGAAGLPASPWVPNPVSPGPGKTDPSQLPKPPDDIGQTPSDTPFVGPGSQLSPATSAELISGQTLGNYIMGKSYQVGS